MSSPLAQPNLLFQEISKGTSYSIDFTIDENIIDQFAALIGDHNPIHLSDSAALRSIYRQRVVHGILPVMYLSFLKCQMPQGEFIHFKSISGRFLKPIEKGTSIKMSIVVEDINPHEGIVNCKYEIKEGNSGRIFTVGACSFKTDAAKKDEDFIPAVSLSNQSSGRIVESVEMRELSVQEIKQGLTESLKCCFHKESVKQLFEILREGIPEKERFNDTDWMRKGDPLTLISNAILSTMVGMRLPGKNAFFLEFRYTINNSFAFDKNYQLIGKVKFKSEATKTMMVHCQYDTSDGSNINLADGSYTSQLIEPQIDMPSIQTIQQEAGDWDLKNKVVLITGASRGLGETTAKLFALQGARVVINYKKNHEAAQKVAAEIGSVGQQAMALCADVSDRRQIHEMVEKVGHAWGAIDILVNNAVGNFHAVAFEELTWGDIEEELAVTLKGAFNCCQEVIPMMISKGAGKIINVSTLAVENPPIYQSKYVIAKSGLNGLTRALAVEYAAKNIQVNLVVPSFVMTDLTKTMSPMAIEQIKLNTPMHRLASPIDVAKAIVSLASSYNAYTTGQKVMVTGGCAPFL